MTEIYLLFYPNFNDISILIKLLTRDDSLFHILLQLYIETETC